MFFLVAKSINHMATITEVFEAIYYTNLARTEGCNPNIVCNYTKNNIKIPTFFYLDQVHIYNPKYCINF